MSWCGWRTRATTWALSPPSEYKLFVLGAWIGAERAYADGHLPDEALHLVHERVDAVLGPEAQSKLFEIKLTPDELAEAAGDVRRVVARLLHVLLEE